MKNASYINLFYLIINNKQANDPGPRLAHNGLIVRTQYPMDPTHDQTLTVDSLGLVVTYFTNALKAAKKLGKRGRGGGGGWGAGGGVGNDEEWS